MNMDNIAFNATMGIIQILQVMYAGIALTLINIVISAIYMMDARNAKMDIICKMISVFPQHL